VYVCIDIHMVLVHIFKWIIRSKKATPKSPVFTS
jgi:hypothetical protein